MNDPNRKKTYLEADFPIMRIGIFKGGRKEGGPGRFLRREAMIRGTEIEKRRYAVFASMKI